MTPGVSKSLTRSARALLIKPKILMLDEPTQGLAPVTVQEMISALKQLKGKFSMIIVEQNKPFLEALSDRTFSMNAGRCEPQITP
jgi:branched-chain amino acid transport system ATP-binding protein